MNNHWDLFQDYCVWCGRFDYYNGFTTYNIPCYCDTFSGEYHLVIRRICHKCKLELMKIAEQTSFTSDFGEHYRELSIAVLPPSMPQP